MTTTGSGSRPGRHVLPGEYLHKGTVFCRYFPKETLETLYDYNYKPDDIILATYPKCGTTWMREIVYGIVKCDELQISEEKTNHVMVRFPFIEFVEEPYSGLKWLEDVPSPRMIKTHLMKRFFVKPLEQKNKIIVVFRNVKDALASYYHYYQHVEAAFDFKGHDFNEFFELFREKHLCHGDWYDWTLDWWSEKDNPNVCFFFYEDMKADIHKATRRVAKFLEKDLTEEQIEFIVRRADFDTMKKQRMAVDKNEKKGGGQLRKGIVGDWRSHFSEEQAQYVDKLTAEKLEGTGLQFKDA